MDEVCLFNLHLKYCAKVMKAKFAEFGPFTRENSTKVRYREFSLSQTKFRCHLSEMSHPQK